jgi:predicted nucleic acid-binding protein
MLTLDANVLIAALKADEPYSDKCTEILAQVPDTFILAEPCIIYQEVCGTLARKTSLHVANTAKEQLDLMIHPTLLTNCDRAFCTSAFPLCSQYNLNAIDALYLQVAINNQSILVSLDKKDFTDKLKTKKPTIEVYHAPEFPY